MDHTEERCQNLEEWKMFQLNTVDVLKQEWRKFHNLAFFTNNFKILKSKVKYLCMHR